jgi:2-keto-3-deoxy-6-phosphogluconate aldolase
VVELAPGVDSRSPIFGNAAWTKGIESTDVFPSNVTGGLATIDDIDDYRGGGAAMSCMKFKGMMIMDSK